MELLRKLAFTLTTMALILSVTVLIVSLFITHTLADEANVKTQLKESGLYDAIATDITTKIAVETDQVDTNEPIIQNAVNDSLNAGIVRKFSEDFIGTTFSWLRGEIPKPVVTLNMAVIRGTFIDSVSSQLKTRLEGLPVCPTGVIPETTDPFKISCWPEGVSIDQQIETVKADLENDPIFNSKGLSAQDITLDTNGSQQPYYEALSYLPKYYRWLTYAPFVSVASILALIGLLVLFARPHEKGFKTTALICLPTGLILIVGGSFIPQFTFLITRPLTSALQGNSFKDPVQSLASNMIGQTGSFFVVRGILLTIIGALFVVWYVLASRQRRGKVHTGRLSRPF